MTVAALSHPITVPAGIAKILGLLVRNCLIFVVQREEGRRTRFRRFKIGGDPDIDTHGGSHGFAGDG